MNINDKIYELTVLSQLFMTTSQLSEIEHFINHGEYGLAIETWVDIVREDNLTPSAAALHLAVSIASDMLLSKTVGIIRGMASHEDEH